MSDNPWPELHFAMNAGNVRFTGVIILLMTPLVGLLLGLIVSQERTQSLGSILAFALPLGQLVYGGVTFLSTLSGWQSRIVLEAERLVIHPTFGRSPRVVDYHQICTVSTQARGSGALIRYYPLDYGGRMDVTRMCQLNLPATSQDDGLRLVLQARLAGRLNRRLELKLISKSMSRRFVFFAVVVGIALLGLVLQPENQRQLEAAAYLGVLELCLILLAVTFRWPIRRKR